MAEYVERTALRDALYDADAITMQGVKILNQFPAADVAPVVHGRWIDVEKSIPWCEDDIEIASLCSVCGACNGIGETPCCPNCGAKMDGESSE